MPLVLTAVEPWLEFFPETREVFSVEVNKEIVDLEIDDVGNLYVLSQSPGSLFVDVFSVEGEKIRSLWDSLALSEYTTPLCLRTSDRGEIVIVRGWDRLLETPVNWVFDSTNTDILDETGLLKYAEWLSVSPLGNYLAMQGYIRRDSEISFVYNLESEKAEFEYQIEHAAFEKIDDNEVIIATEIRPEGRYLVIRDMETREIYMERKLTTAESNVIVQEDKSALTDDALFVLTRACRNPALYCYDRNTGELLWEDETKLDVAAIEPTMKRDATSVQGYLCSWILTADETPILDYCEDFKTADTRLLMSLDTNPTVWSDIQVLAVSYSIFTKYFEYFSIVLPYSNPEMLIPVQFEGKIDGFLLDDDSYIVYAKDRSVIVYKIID